jgi:hypothetical protein
MLEPIMDHTSMDKDGCKDHRCFTSDDWWYNKGLIYLIVVHIVCSSILVLNDHVVQNDICTYDDTKYLVAKIMTWDSEGMKRALRPQMLSLSLSAHMKQTSTTLESMWGEWYSQHWALWVDDIDKIVPLPVLMSIHHEVHIWCFSPEYINGQRWLVEHGMIHLRKYSEHSQAFPYFDIWINGVSNAKIGEHGESICALW